MFLPNVSEVDMSWVIIINRIDLNKYTKPAVTVRRHHSITAKHIGSSVTLPRFESWADCLTCLQLYSNYFISLHYTFPSVIYKWAIVLKRLSGEAIWLKIETLGDINSIICWLKITLHVSCTMTCTWKITLYS